MAMNIHQCLLRHAQQGESAGIIQPGDIAPNGKRGLDARTGRETAREYIDGQSKAAIGELDGIMEERKGPYFLADLARDLPNFPDEAAVLRVFDLKPRDAQLKTCDQLAGRVVQLLPQPPALVVQSAEKMLHPVRLRRRIRRTRRAKVEGRGGSRFPRSIVTRGRKGLWLASPHFDPVCPQT